MLRSLKANKNALHREGQGYSRGVQVIHVLISFFSRHESRLCRCGSNVWLWSRIGCLTLSIFFTFPKENITYANALVSPLIGLVGYSIRPTADVVRVVLPTGTRTRHTHMVV